MSEQVRKEYEAALSTHSAEIKQLATQTRKSFEAVVGTKPIAAYNVLKGKIFVPK